MGEVFPWYDPDGAPGLPVGVAVTYREPKRPRKSRCEYGFKFVNTDRSPRARPAAKKRK